MFGVRGQCNYLFQTDRWLLAGRIRDLTIKLTVMVSRPTVKGRRDRERLPGSWLDDFSSDLSALAIVKLIDLADRLVEVELFLGQDDIFGGSRT